MLASNVSLQLAFHCVTIIDTM